MRSPACFLAILLGLGVSSLTAGEDDVPRVKSVASPHRVDDDGHGVEILVHVEFLEEAAASGTVKLVLVADEDQPGEAEWKDKAELTAPYNAKDRKVEIRATIRILRNGRIGIKAETAPDEGSDDAYNWMDVTIKK